MKVSAVVITNRDDDVVAHALRSLAAQAHRPLELVLFGNGAALEAPPEVAAAGVDVRVGASPTDLGVAGGRNAAAALATGDALLFLDDDAILRPGALDAAVAVLARTPDVGAVAFRVVDPRTRRTALWLYPLDVATWEGRRFDAPTVVGCGGLVRRDVFARLGGFWEGYHREVEELDLCWRMMSAGWRIRYEPDAVVEHPERVSRRLYRYAVPANVVLPYRLLPPGLAARQAAVKVPLFAARAVRYGEVGDFAGGLRLLPAMLRRARRERAPLDARTVAYLRGLHAQEGWRGRVQWALRPPPPPELHAG